MRVICPHGPIVWLDWLVREGHSLAHPDRLILGLILGPDHSAETGNDHSVPATVRATPHQKGSEPMIDSPATTALTGLGHYRAAAALLAEVGNSHTATATLRAEMIARAQVHATLALAAATILNDGADGLGEPDRTPWRDAVAEATS